MKTVIFGLGYVGAVSAACLAELGHEVIGTDINPVKVDIINRGKSPIVEERVEEIICEQVQSGRLRATTDYERALNGAEIVIICVGTPNREDGSHSLDAIERTCEMIGDNMARLAPYPVIMARSTILPGTTESLIIPTLEARSGRRAGVDFGVCFNPEFLREGSSVYDFYNPPYTVIGSADEQTFARASRLYDGISAPINQTSIGVAEMVKMLSNTFHALKVSFANEVGSICKQYGIDSHQVMDLFCQDKKLNISPAYLKPGFAFGGSCLPKDIRALQYMSRQKNVDVPVIDSIMESNEVQIRHGYNLVAETRKKHIGFLGFSFKEGTDDLRFSAQVELIERLIGKGYHVYLYDQNVSLARLHGANKAFIEKEIPHISSLMYDSIEAVLEKSEVIVIGNKDASFAKVVDLLKPDQILIDLVRIVKDVSNLNGNYKGIGW